MSVNASDAGVATGPNKSWRLLLVALAAVAVGVVIHAITDSVLWSVVGVVVGLPVAGFLVVLLVATVQHQAAERERKTQVPVGAGRVIADPTQKAICIDTVPPQAPLSGDRLALWLCEYFDYCVVRYNASNWAPSDPGGQLWPRARTWLLELQPKLVAGAGSPANPIDFGDLGGWTYRSGASERDRSSVRIDLRLVRGSKGYACLTSETMGQLHRGDVLAESFFAVAAHVLNSGQVDPKEVGAMLLAQCEIYRSKGNTMVQGRAVSEALTQQPAFAARLAAV
ncbi:hypothetical protein [Chondromyces crocatus]|uniref:Uncharacterized protein n=1 Tax=Chondromyces crocatus TaxID=52 RepID=A0A0K1ECG1_CHOCO|nr:hypothetical protein [Chondromyces crocatus]AKT38377.1 uncharacterized protein CMC5_025230 [Chondromyces crocatus]